MKLEWKIRPRDVETILALVARYDDDPFVRRRKKRNLGVPRPPITRRTAWMALVGCLLTTQQRSGPGTAVKRLLDLKPFPLRYKECLSQSNVSGFARATLSSFGGIRRSNIIGRQIAQNLESLECGLWDSLLEQATAINGLDNFSAERLTARFIADSFHGFGPKQSRNFLQWLGASKYEIPIDSRITKWLNANLLSFSLNSTLLADSTYYEMVSDGIIKLCRLADIYPCVFDAAVFTSFDNGKWAEDPLSSETLDGA